MKQVVVTVVGTQRDADGEENRIELVTVGKYYTKNNIHYITYQESTVSGMEGTTTLIKLYPSHAAVVRMGQIEQKQEFREGQRSRSTYVTPFGTMRMSVYTSRLAVDIAGTTGNIEIEYDLEIEGQWQSANKLSVKIREDERQDGY
ncbi:DUF1934 domain-containing protein [Sporolituus thermophilus]|uniref:Uncharacterized beta-barrel protein YwiB, DUF1934 family n=1 Tax=Sporolituus thermophilus DSM 23256 TaxID=1123285 RepID=A0A1G7IU05_9FIRM|nr:DUF1934 domain-containing protein [Sporolituus thermophilus]SDF16180.1 Uncharacterized beta-barrel protein YwiB, DUF1934 family [Sporolituus thermophilus DSM 23256]